MESLSFEENKLLPEWSTSIPVVAWRVKENIIQSLKDNNQPLSIRWRNYDQEVKQHLYFLFFPISLWWNWNRAVPMVKIWISQEPEARIKSLSWNQAWWNPYREMSYLMHSWTDRTRILQTEREIHKLLEEKWYRIRLDPWNRPSNWDTELFSPSFLSDSDSVKQIKEILNRNNIEYEWFGGNSNYEEMWFWIQEWSTQNILWQCSKIRQSYAGGKKQYAKIRRNTACDINFVAHYPHMPSSSEIDEKLEKIRKKHKNVRWKYIVYLKERADFLDAICNNYAQLQWKWNFRNFLLKSWDEEKKMRRKIIVDSCKQTRNKWMGQLWDSHNYLENLYWKWYVNKWKKPFQYGTDVSI